MMKIWFIVFVFCCCVLVETAETDKSHIITKRAAEEPTDLQLENELRRVKRIIEPQNALSRAKRMKRQNHLEKDLLRLKREKRSLPEPELSRMKRGNIDDSPELSRVKRFNDLKANIATLVRVKRLRRSVLNSMRALDEPDLARVKRMKRSINPMDFAMPTLYRMKRNHDRNAIELSRVKRMKRSAAMMKRIPPDLHKLKRLRNRNLEKAANAKRAHFKAMKGYSARNKDFHKRGNHSRNVESFKQRVQNRLRSRHRKRLSHRKQKAKNDKHHVQSHRLNKKSLI